MPVAVLSAHPQQRRVLAATSISYVVVLLDASIVNVALERMGMALSTGMAGLQWVVSAYTLSFASLLLTGGMLGDRWGARNVYLAGLSIFTLASMLCGIAPNLTVLVTARAMQGIGAAMLVPCSLKLINHAYTDPGARAGAIGLWVGAGGIAMAAGPLIGGALIQLFSWRSIFFANAPIGLIGLWLTCRIARDESERRTTPLDLAGQVTAILSLGSLIALLIEGPTRGWLSIEIVSASAVCIMASIAFIVIESRSSAPMLPLAFFRHPIFTGSTLISMASAFVFYGLLFVLSLYYQQSRGYSPLQAGLAFLPMTVMVAVGSLLSSRLVNIAGARIAMCMAFTCYIVGALGMLSFSSRSPYWVAMLPMLATGFASGFISPAATAPAMGTVKKTHSGVAAAVLNTARQSGAALGVAIFGALLAMLHPFECGMHAALWVAATVSLLALWIWWFALMQKTDTSALVGRDLA